VLDDSNPPFYKWFTGGKIKKRVKKRKTKERE